MKLVMRHWQWLLGILTAGAICASYMVAQTQNSTGGAYQNTQLASMKTPFPAQQESVDCARLIDAVNAGDAQTALEILHPYGVADDTLLAMGSRLGKSPLRAELREPFLKASVAALALTDVVVKTNVQARLQDAIATMGYQRPIWMAHSTNLLEFASYDADLAQCPVPPMAVLNETSDDSCLIRYFKWYDRYADSLHSVVLNGPNLSNAKLDPANYHQANRTLNALFQLIKARKPDAFVWLSVVKEDNHSDEDWLEAMTFRPDGLQISNLRQFNSPFGETRARYMAIVGTNTPMMVSGFYGYKTALDEKGTILATAIRNTNPKVRQVAEAAANQQIGSIGVMAAQNLSQLETNLQSMGYRGISVHWLLLAALANSRNAAAGDRSELLDSRAGLLDIYYNQGDYARVSSLAADIISKSTPGDLDWTMGKLYEAIAWLSQKPPRTADAVAALDEILSFDFGNRPGRDHYILGAVKWRIYAASVSGDAGKRRQLVQWVQDREFRQDLKAAFLKQYESILNQPTTPSK